MKNIYLTSYEKCRLNAKFNDATKKLYYNATRHIKSVIGYCRPK